MKFRNKIRYFFIKHPSIGHVCRYFYSSIFKRNRLEKSINFGKLNADKIIYVIRPDSEDGIQGLMSLFIQVMRKIDYANKMDYIPYVDFKNYNTQYSDGKNNAWEFFFSQPSLLEYSEVYNSKNVILSGLRLKKLENDTLYKDTIFFDNELCVKCNKIIIDNINFSKEVEEILSREIRIISPKNCMGVYLRGTDYTALKPTGEHIQPQIDKVIEEMKKMNRKNPELNFFLVTEDEAIYSEIKLVFNDKIKIVSFDKFIAGYDSKVFLSESDLLDKDRKRRGIEYLVKLVILSKCQYLISSITMGSIATYALNGNKYTGNCIFDLGIYK